MDKQDVIFSNGVRVIHTPMASGATWVEKEDGTIMTDDEWEAYCLLMRSQRAEAKKQAAKDRKNLARRLKDQAYRDLGMHKVKGALGGTYYE